MPGVYSSKQGLDAASIAMMNGIPAFTPEYETTTDIEFNEKEPGMKVALTGLQNVLKKLNMINGEIKGQTGIKILEGNFEAQGMPVTKRGGVTRRTVDVGVKLKKGTP